MSSQEVQLQCPLPKGAHDQIVLGHGGGGRLMHELIRDTFTRAFDNPLLAQGHDGAVCSLEQGRFAFTTDSYVVRPLFFPGGDIGSLAVYGTVNDLAMCGANPLYLSTGFILEEGLPHETLQRVVRSMATAAKASGVQLVTGDTKVVDKGKGDGIFINTAGIGIIPQGVSIGPRGVRTGDRIVVSGDLGAHGIAVLSVREGLSFSGDIQSDSAPLNAVVDDLLGSGIHVSCLRDLTRGGLASALNEIASAGNVGMLIEEEQVPVREPIRGACEIMGLDPLYVANEGRFVAFVPAHQVNEALAVLRRHQVSRNATQIGEVTGHAEPCVVLRTPFHTNRILDLLSGEQLPRIC